MFYITVLQNNKITHFHTVDEYNVMETFQIYTSQKNGDLNILVSETCAAFYEEGTKMDRMTVILTGPLTYEMMDHIKSLSNA